MTVLLAIGSSYSQDQGWLFMSYVAVLFTKLPLPDRHWKLLVQKVEGPAY